MKEWTIEKINQYISAGVEESIHLDYKQLASLSKESGRIDEMIKDITAFANSDGGDVIYGVIEDKNTHKPIAVDSSTLNSGINREWIDNTLDSHIEPKIDGLLITPIDNLDSGNQLFVISIPKSHRAPHMARDHKYYKRYNFKSQPMEHYEIEDIRNRTICPNIRAKINIGPKTVKTEKEFNCAELAVYLESYNENIALNYCVVLIVPESLKVTNCSWQALGDRSLYVGYKLIHGNVFMKICSPSNSMPIWKGVEYNAMNPDCYITFPISEPEFKYDFYIEVRAPGMRRRTFKSSITGGDYGWGFSHDEDPIYTNNNT
jgi:hypothetical protein